jgi:hypothetical protein
LARASNVKQQPSGDSPPNLSTPIALSGMMLRFTPPASASVDSSRSRLSQARCTVTSADEQAESTVMLGPCRPSVYETRFAMMLR